MPHPVRLQSPRQLTRRQMLCTSLALGGFVLPTLGAAATTRRRARSAIVVLLEGGMSHLDTWDPKPAAPVEIRGPFQTIATSLPSLRFGEHLPLLARQAHLFNMVRSVHSTARCHSPGLHWVLTGYDDPDVGTDRRRHNEKHPSQGAVVAHQLGVAANGLPRFVTLPRRSQLGGQVTFTRSTFLGAACEGFETGEPPAEADKPMQLPPNLLLPADVPFQRLENRRRLLQALDRLEADRGQASQRDVHHDRAFQILSSQRMALALDVNREPQPLRERYGGNRYGQGLLLARRLVEAGVTYVLVNCSANNDWDTHADNFNLLKNKLLPPMDRAVAVLLQDLEQRGMLDQTLVVVMSEMGRTPTIAANNAGRDHWPDAYSVLLAGGGLTRGQVLGSTTAGGHKPGERPVPVGDVLATIYHQLGIDPDTLLHDELNRPFPILPDAKPIRELIA